MFSPFEQFKLFFFYKFDIFKYSIFISNFTIYNIIVYLIISLLFFIFYKNIFKSSIYNELLKNYYTFSYSTVFGQVSHRGMTFIPFLQYVFLFVAICNIIGMIPYNFSLTSHIAFVLGLSLFIFIGFNIIGLYKFHLHFFSFFVPKGVPAGFVPFITLIEVISYLFRVVSLSMRLVANIVAGHLLLKLMMGFIFNMFSYASLLTLALICLALIFTLVCLEIAIAFLQAYVYLILCSIYLKDVLTVDEH